MNTVIIEPADADLIRLGPGDVLSFGRGAPGAPVGLELAGAGVSRRAGEVVAVDDHWRISNYSGTTTYVVENLEGAGEHVKVAPGRIGAPIPFEISRVVLPVADGFVGFTVYAPQHSYVEPAGDGESGDRTVVPFALDPGAKYFLVLLALCEPRLRDASAVAIPNAGEVVARLRPLPSCADLTRSAVNYHIDYLATAKLRLRQREGTDDAARMDWKREALVSLALRYDLVRDEHLRMLPSRRAAE
ncbi:serine/threonine protein kinase [Catenulispora subtropica]|uniref:FHA domain-containing protein n=1 Tax=Catenulispora subtropica TaxID=450798 RepID=A0ABN2QY32_9ACTN